MFLLLSGPCGVVGKFGSSGPTFQLEASSLIICLRCLQAVSGNSWSATSSWACPRMACDSFLALDLLWSLGGLLDFLSFIPVHAHLVTFINSVGKARLMFWNLKVDDVTYAEGSSESRCSFRSWLGRRGFVWNCSCHFLPEPLQCLTLGLQY